MVPPLFLVSSILVEMESLFPGCHEQLLSHDLFGGVVGQLEVVDAGVDGGVGAVSSVDLADDRQTWEEISEATWTTKRNERIYVLK